MKISRYFLIALAASSLTFVSCEELPSVEKPNETPETPVDPDEEDEDEPSGPVEETVAASLQDPRTDYDLIPVETGEAVATQVSVELSLEKASEANSTVEVYVDNDYVEEYNIKNGTDYLPFPADRISFVDGQELAVAAGGTASGRLAVAFDAADDALWSDPATEYFVSVCIKEHSENVSVNKADGRVNYLVKRRAQDKIKNVLYFQINDVNPLNALEYVLEDGRYFFDAVILFAGNLWYNPVTGRCQFGGEGEERNTNIDALLEESETYIQPLRRAGIKVYLGILPHHSGAWLDNLSAYGCEEFSKEIAGIVKDAGLDGVNLDNEYGGSLPSGYNKEWFEPSAGGSYMCFQMKKQMADLVPWPTEVSVYMWSRKDYESVTFEGETYNAGDFIDFHVADYGGGTVPVNGIGWSGCSAASVELNLHKGGFSSTDGWQGKYGWCMWFSFNPMKDTPEDPYPQHLEYSMDYFNRMAEPVFGQKVQQPKGYYKKLGQAHYDPTRYEF